MTSLRRRLCSAPLLLTACGLTMSITYLTGMAEAQAAVLASAGRTELGAGRAYVPLSGPRPLAGSLQSLPPGQQVYLVLRDLRADAPPGVVFNLYLGVPPGAAPPGADDGRYVGTLNFFSAVPPAAGGRQVSFVVTNLLASLRARGEVLTGTGVTVAAEEGAPAAGSRPTIGSIELVAQ